MDRIDTQIASLKEDAGHGATFLTLQAVRILADAASTGGPSADWPGHLHDVCRRLAEAKPAMASVKNAARHLLHQLLTLDPVEGRRRALSLARGLAAQLQASADAAAVNASHLISRGAIVITCSYSSAVIRAVQDAHLSGKAPVATVLEPTTDASHGARLARELRAAGVEARLVDSLAGDDTIGHADLALVGADSITPKFFVNGSPTLALVHATSGRIPLYVVGDTMKLSREASVEPGYDQVPLTLVEGIVTERGITAPTDVEDLVDSPWAALGSDRLRVMASEPRD